jgi:hypothetical protein
MKYPIAVILMAVLGLSGASQCSGAVDSVGTAGHIVIMGWLESIHVQPWGVRLTAKLDTGAKTSSLHASRVEHFRKGDTNWVRFELYDQEAGKKIMVERPLTRTAYIKERKAGVSPRDVVMMQLCKNGRTYDTEITLVDRSNFNYPLLLGRSFLEGVAYVDSGATFLYPGDRDTCHAGRRN